MTVIDLFSGCGGLSKGFSDAGCKVLLGVDIDRAALQTFERNHPQAVGLEGSLAENPTFEKMREVIGSREVDIIVGGPPCQGFSLTGPRNFDDDRNKQGEDDDDGGLPEGISQHRHKVFTEVGVNHECLFVVFKTQGAHYECAHIGLYIVE